MCVIMCCGGNNWAGVAFEGKVILDLTHLASFLLLQ